MIKAVVISGISGTLLFSNVAFVPGARNSGPQIAVKSDRLDLIRFGPACSRRAWPYYDNTCLHDVRRPGGHASRVRIVTSDRLPLVEPEARHTK